MSSGPNPPELVVSCMFGAPMGRHTGGQDYDADGRFTLRRAHLDNGGYDAGGAYWGLGEALYYYASPDGTAEGYLRARSREAAKREIREDYPNSRFYR